MRLRQLFVISDLHIGGESGGSLAPDRGFRMCTQTSVLADFISQVACEPAGSSEIVINGDFVDFLAEAHDGDRRWMPFISDETAASTILRRVMEREAQVFSALGQLVANRHRLTIVLGNHDIELSFPQLRRALASALGTSEGDSLHFVCDGEAYVVGDVLIEHGNRYDDWNGVDHDSLRRHRSRLSRREDTDEDFEPPAGSLLVSRVMNEIKGMYPFVDLLKPENDVVVPILLALAPQLKSEIAKVAGIQARRSWKKHGFRIARRSEGDVALGSDTALHLAGMQDAEEALAALMANRLGVPLVGKAAAPATLGDAGGIDSARAWARLLLPQEDRPLGDSTIGALKTALESARSSFDFDRTREQPKYLDAARRKIDKGFKAVIFGHTHLAKQVECGAGVYLNTGTWTDLMPFPFTLLDDDDAHGKLLSFLGDMKESRLQPYIRFAPTYAQVSLGQTGELLDCSLREFAGSLCS